MKDNGDGPKTEVCGIVMPISSIDSCSEEHWRDVREILYEAIEEADFEPHMVSDADDVGIIQKRIIQNLYENPIVVCDVSCKNPNVMFELGMRLAFDKATIIIKDDKTTYSFDTAPIEHLSYPRDLRYSKMIDFKEQLSQKIKATHEKATSDAHYTTFLKHFGKFKVVKLDTQEVSADQIVLDEIRSLRELVALSVGTIKPQYTALQGTQKMRILCLQDHKGPTEEFLEELRDAGLSIEGPIDTKNDHLHYIVNTVDSSTLTAIKEIAVKYVPNARYLRNPTRRQTSQ